MKRKLTLSVDENLIKEAKEQRINMSATMESILSKELGYIFNYRNQTWVKGRNKNEIL